MTNEKTIQARFCNGLSIYIYTISDVYETQLQSIWYTAATRDVYMMASVGQITLYEHFHDCILCIRVHRTIHV